jgi:hypothetical protein
MYSFPFGTSADYTDTRPSQANSNKKTGLFEGVVTIDTMETVSSFSPASPRARRLFFSHVSSEIPPRQPTSQIRLTSAVLSVWRAKGTRTAICSAARHLG